MDKETLKMNIYSLKRNSIATLRNLAPMASLSIPPISTINEANSKLLKDFQHVLLYELRR